MRIASFTTTALAALFLTGAAASESRADDVNVPGIIGNALQGDIPGVIANSNGNWQHGSSWNGYGYGNNFYSDGVYPDRWNSRYGYNSYPYGYNSYNYGWSSGYPRYNYGYVAPSYGYSTVTPNYSGQYSSGYWTQPQGNPPVNVEPTRAVVLNPAASGATLNFSVNGQSQSVAPGQSRDVTAPPESVIEFDRGTGKGFARYRLSEGVYTFTPTERGWELFRSPLDANRASATAGRTNDATIR